MIVKDLIITNNRGDTLSFGRHFKIIEDIDLSNLTASVNYSDSTDDGSTYQNTRLENRDIDVFFLIEKEMNEPWWFEEKRMEVFKVCNPKFNPFRIDFRTSGGKEYYVQANLENAPSFPKGFENSNQVWQKGLLQFSCNDPFIYQKEEKKVDIALWVGGFGFPLQIPADTGIQMGYRNPSLIVNVLNDGQETTGMIIRFKALGTLTNPSLINVNTYETLKINTTMLAGDIIEISTYKRRKKVLLQRNGVETNIFTKLDLTSVFLLLEIGDNLFRYNAETGIDNLEVSMHYTPRLLGV